MDEVLQRELQRSYTPEQMNEFTVVLELKYLAAHAPNGVFIGNDRNNLKKLHGLIFIKRGLYQDGVFRFVIDLPSSYNSIGSQPIVKFTSKIYNPFVDAATGLLDLKLAAEFSRWDPSTHSLTTIATTVKRIFLMRSFEKYASRAPNEDAAKLFVSDKAAFVEQVGKCVKESLDNRMKPPHADCPFVFRERTPGIFFIREALFGQKGDGGDKNVGERDERGDDGGEVYG